ncbi:phosphodiesterase [Roseinatronobacter sp. S2]|uniref:phosphodiesterase n=1 Tax=Roseinatronobacter sp. S2 TaxID=3035471 RepID=UPI00241057D1|nr:phosphodiesterase [Roseinatronobacter sp. S2]WFE73987.1 phosphodiesterase [Roseinatronobacter sp. S2]
MKKLIWLTDLHLVEQGQDWPQGVDPLARLRLCLDEIAAVHCDADRLVVTGDLIQLRNPGAYAILRAELERLPFPYRLLVGNHDDRGALRSIFPANNCIDGFVQGFENVDGTQLLYLDTQAADGKHHGELCPTRERWITGQIEAAGEEPLLIFLHHPPCDIGVPALDRLKLLNADRLTGLLKRRRRPTHLFCGHVHRNVSGLWAGNPFATLKSLHVQFDLNMADDDMSRSLERPGYAVVLVGSSKIVVNYRDLQAS